MSDEITNMETPMHVDNDFTDPVPVHVVEVQMSFFGMVAFMLKWSIAAIPSLIILVGFALGVTFLLGVLGALIAA